MFRQTSARTGLRRSCKNLRRRSISLTAIAAAVLFHAVLLAVLFIGDDTEIGPPSAAQTVRSPAPPPAAVPSPQLALVSSDDAVPPLESVLLESFGRPFTGDLAAIRKRRVLRALVSYSQTNFFFDGGTTHGYEYEKLRELEKFLNRGVQDRTRRLHVVLVPTPFSELPSALADGRGDIAAAGLTITPERLKKVAFTDPYLADVSEVVVSHKSIERLGSLTDLAGREIYVRRGSSYVDHLMTLNERFRERKQGEAKIRQLDSPLATEDILQLVNAGVLDVTVADQHIAEAWAQVLPDIEVHSRLAINSGGQIAWAVRKNNPQLFKTLNRFIAKNKKGSRFGNIVFNRYYRDVKWIKNPVAEGEQKKLRNIETLFRKYGEQYGFDWLAVAAQAYQESGLDQGKVSRSGAVGIMQIKPSTAADRAVGIGNVRDLENNVHAGVKYLHHLRNRYFNDPVIDPFNQIVFSWAAYNAGPGRIKGLRKRARQAGLDPNVWFGSVERIAAQQVGREPVEYVANIYKYYVAYRLAYDLLDEKFRMLQRLTAG
jgi:membrane-bound lytic murein transglycosylase MltF